MKSNEDFKEKKKRWNFIPQSSTGQMANKELSEKWLNGVIQPEFTL